MKINYKFFTGALLLIAAMSANAQVTLGTQAVSSAGDYYTGSFGSLQVNIGGEPSIETISGNGSVFTQGFEQPSSKTVGIISLPANAPTVSLFPNPASGEVNVAFNLPNGGKLSFRIFDMAGRELIGTTKQTQSGQQTEVLNLDNLSQGLYMLNIVFEGNDNTKSFSVVKRFEVIK
jgi:Secretion system C-terminal sorting domain